MNSFCMTAQLLPRLLIVDDEPPVREFLSEALETCCASVAAVEGLPAALRAIETQEFDVLLADICMPGGTGLDLLALAHQLNWDCSVILMTGHAEMNHVVAGVRLHAADFLLKPFSLDTLQHSVQQSFQKLQSARYHRTERASLTIDLRQRTEQLKFAQHLLTDSYRATLESLVATLEAREPGTYAHSFRVRTYALHLAEALNYPKTDLPLLGYAALLHDIGKVAVCDAILLKPGQLTPEEFETLKTHSAIGERIVKRMGFLTGALKIVRHHHEAWDGRGYPDGISGTDIPLGSRIFAIADTLDAMTSNRCYREGLTIDAAREEIQRCAGTQFDPAIVQVFANVPDAVLWRLRGQADSDARAAIIPEINPGDCSLCAVMPPPLFPAAAEV
jgi:cyclic di-GMP phosphodiesterase